MGIRARHLYGNALINCINVYHGVICPYERDLIGLTTEEFIDVIDLFLDAADGQYTIDADGNWYEEGRMI